MKVKRGHDLYRYYDTEPHNSNEVWTQTPLELYKGIKYVSINTNTPCCVKQGLPGTNPGLPTSSE